MFSKLKLYYKKIKRVNRIKKLKKKIPPYLLKDFEVELNYKLWSTKGARFAASIRTSKLHKLSGQCVVYLSAYLIIIGAVKIYGLDFWLLPLNDRHVNFASMAFSVLILLFSQLESSENYILKSERYHNCALDISELYNKLRYTKAYVSNIEDRQKELLRINYEYDLILKKYDNHLPIDYSMFQTQKPDYFNLNVIDKLSIKIEAYLRVSFRYHILIYGPIIAFLICNFYIILTK